MEDNKKIVISLGGSLIVPNEIDVDFIKSFIIFIKEYVSKGYVFLIITGGGKTCRKYNSALLEITQSSEENLDWLGIETTRLNAELIRICFEDLAYEKIVLNPDIIPITDRPIIIGGGWKPGNSSDLAAVHSAKSVGAKKVINLSNIDYAHDKDPKKFPDAIIIKESSWRDFIKILPEKWEPGLSSPFDPVAAREAEGLGLEVVIMNGRNIENLKNYLDGKEFIGTVIK